MQFFLVPHSDSPPVAIEAVTADLRWEASSLRITYSVIGNAQAVVIPAPAPPVHTDELWQTTCFELFAHMRDSAYVEYNFSPSGAWAQYGFSSHRSGRRPLAPLVLPPMITVTSENDRINVDVVTMEQSVAGGRIGVSAVIEEVDGTKSYWALAHAPGPPDFHNPACFAHHLPPFEPE